VVAEILRAHPGLSTSLHTMDSPGIARAVAMGRTDLTPRISEFRLQVRIANACAQSNPR
jgi:hypothetical protein